MERNREESTAQENEHSVPAEERSGRADHSKSTDNSPMLPAECQAEGRNLDTDITLIHEFKPGMPNERFLWNALKQAERRNKILQEERNSKDDHGTRKGHNDACVTNTQTDTITYSKIQTNKQKNQSNKEILKKIHDTTNSKATLTLEKDYVHWANRLLIEI